MKLLHTSDWHLGQSFYGHDRQEEQQEFLNQIANIAHDNQPDLMVVSGDIFHNSNPSTAAQGLYIDALLNIRKLCPNLPIVITAGNHDSCSKLEVDHKLWNFLGITVIGTVRWDSDLDNIDRHIVPIHNADNELIAYVIAIPHCYATNFPNLDGKTPREQRLQKFFQTLQTRVEELNTANVPVVVMAHLAVAGSDITGHDDVVGGMDYVQLAGLGDKYDYLALGHIHCPQTIVGGKARYCGSPIAINFDEQYTHSVTIAEVNHGEKPVISTIELSNPHPLVTIPDEPMPFEEALDELRKFESDKSCYIRLNVLIKDFLSPDDSVKVNDVCTEMSHRYCLIKITRPATTTSAESIALTINELQSTSPLDIARAHYRASTGDDMDDELTALLSQVIEQTKNSAL